MQHSAGQGNRSAVDVLLFIGILVIYIWVVIPGTLGAPFWKTLFTTLAVAVAALSVWRNGTTWQSVGLRLDNLFPALLVYLGLALPYAGLVLFWHRGSIGSGGLEWPGAIWGAAGLITWAFAQQFCLLAFLLCRLRQILGRDVAAIVAAAGIFAFFHLPNPFLTLYTLGGGLILAALFVRLPNLWAAALAHAAASALVGGLLPAVITGSMKVGPLYLWTHWLE